MKWWSYELESKCWTYVLNACHLNLYVFLLSIINCLFFNIFYYLLIYFCWLGHNKLSPTTTWWIVCGQPKPKESSKIECGIMSQVDISLHSFHCSKSSAIGIPYNKILWCHGMHNKGWEKGNSGCWSKEFPCFNISKITGYIHE